MAIEECKKHDLKQTVYFLNRELMFRKDVSLIKPRIFFNFIFNLQHEQVLITEMIKRKVPQREFTLYRKIWFPKNWIISRLETDKEPVVVKPNVFEDKFLNHHHSHENQNVLNSITFTIKMSVNICLKKLIISG